MSECQFDRSLAIRQRQGALFGAESRAIVSIAQETIGTIVLHSRKRLGQSFYTPGNDRDNRSTLLLLDFRGCVIIKNVLTLEWQLESV